MVAESAEHPKSVDLLREVLLDYLQAGWVRNWPGADGITVDDILNCYPQASASGDVPDWQELCRRHTELIAEIRSLFTLKGWLTSRDPEGFAQSQQNK